MEGDAGWVGWEMCVLTSCRVDHVRVWEERLGGCFINAAARPWPRIILHHY